MQREQVGGGLRRHITEFSRGSRRRLMNDVYSINFDRVELPYFVTLTYHDEWPSEAAEWKAQVKALARRLERTWGHLAYYWRLEFQERGAPHLHLLLWFEDSSSHISHPVERIRRFRNNVAWAWNEIVDPSDHDHLEAGTSVEPCRNLRHLTGYLSKYVAKTEQIQTPPAGIGRVWGSWRAKGKRGVLPRNPYFVVLTPDQWIKVRRVLAGFSGQRIFSPRPKDRQVRINNGISAYLSYSTALRLLRWLGQNVDPPPYAGARQRAQRSEHAAPRRRNGAGSSVAPALLAVGRG